MRKASVASGISADSVAAADLGWEDVFFSEIEPFPSAVLAHHYPGVPNLGDMTKIDGAEYRGLVDLLVGGTPCQAFSSAGQRKSLSDDRGNLALVFTELVHAIDPSFVLWENVPGVLNTRDNAFGCFLAGLVGADAPLRSPRKRGSWPDAGMVDGPKRTAAWRVFDAQYFGLAQRRRRVFVLSGRAGDFRPAEILFEPESLRRHSPPSRETGSSVAALTANGVGTCGADDNQGQAGHIIPALTTKPYSDREGEESKLVVMATGQASAEIVEDGCPTLNCNHEAPIVFNYKASASRALTPSSDVAATLRSNGGGQLAVAYQCHGSNVGPMGTLRVGNGNETGGVPFVVSLRGREGGSMPEVDESGVSPALRTGQGGSGNPMVCRLIPRECERLQGFPDDYTLIPWRGKDYADCPDGPRYKALGNSIAIPVLRWIFERIEAVEARG